MKKYTLECCNFIAGLLCMIIEVVAARILSPYLGSSNLIWTCIIGMMLVFMSVGYFLGGKLADKKPSRNIMSLFILNAAFFVSLIPIIEVSVIKPLSLLNSIINPSIIAILCSSITFGPASLFLATVSPFAVKLKEKDLNGIGEVSGRMSALNTIGSILGTFLAGFVLIPNIGVKNIILITTVITFLLSFVIYEDKNFKYVLKSLAVLVLLVGFVFLGKKMFNEDNPDIILDTDSEYSRIWIKKFNKDENQYYTLEVDTGYESIATENGTLYSDYMKYYNLFDYYKQDSQDVLMIGGAAYIYPTYFLNNFEGKNIDVVEIDSKMTNLAEEYFNLDRNNPRLTIYHQDGRTYLNNPQKKYDCILIDAFKGINAPFHLATYEALMNSKEALNDGGMVITNIASSLTGVNSDFIQYEYATYKAVFDEVKLFRTQGDMFGDSELQNLVLIGFKNKSLENDEKFEVYKEFLGNEITDFTSSKPIVTDDYCPIGV
ncbi:MAG: fused MFS/spermidine synthase [Clostridia bacterium]|nr:fused MFS/spermidine synthase [Clostridia bacterium]